MHYVNLKQAIEKLETELLFLKDVNIRDWMFKFKECYVESLQQRFCTQNKTKNKTRKLYFRTAIKFTYSFALTWKVRNDGGSFVR